MGFTLSATIMCNLRHFEFQFHFTVSSITIKIASKLLSIYLKFGDWRVMECSWFQLVELLSSSFFFVKSLNFFFFFPFRRSLCISAILTIVMLIFLFSGFWISSFIWLLSLPSKWWVHDLYCALQWDRHKWLYSAGKKNFECKAGPQQITPVRIKEPAHKSFWIISWGECEGWARKELKFHYMSQNSPSPLPRASEFSEPECNLKWRWVNRERKGRYFYKNIRWYVIYIPKRSEHLPVYQFTTGSTAHKTLGRWA